MKVIDTHTHVFPPEIIRDREKIALKDRRFAVIYGNPGAKMADIEEVRAYTGREGIASCVLSGFSFQDEGLLGLTNDYILETASASPAFVPFIQVSADNEKKALHEMERCFAAGARGVGEIALYERDLDGEALRALEGVAQYAQEKKKIIMLHMNEQVGHAYRGKVRVDYEAVIRFIERHQDMDFILSHLGGGLCFFELMPEIRKALGRVYYDTAATPFVYSADIYRLIDEFLWEKVLFGSDYPLLSLERYSPGLLLMKKERRDAVLSGNAERLFGNV